MGLLAKDLEGADVLDLFAGTGAVGLEALSRGAARCDFVENGPAAIHSLKANVAALKAKTRTRVFLTDAIPFVERIDHPSYDIAFTDPPYGSRRLDRVLAHWKAVPFSRILAIEHAADHPTPLKGGRSKRIGDSVVTVLRQPG
jgi:16S rRNA (guanine966-N2)-methyltransferase